MAKVLLAANTGWYLYNFRLPLARELRRRGHEVVLTSPRDPYVERLQADAFRWIELPLARASTNPLREARTLLNVVRIYREIQPDLVHHFTIKCVLYGTLAARFLGIPAVVNAVTGLGHLFIDEGARARRLAPIIRGLYRLTLRDRRVRVIFQNPDDLEAFESHGLVRPERCSVISSSGVDIERFAPTPLPPRDGRPVVLFASRLLAEKGIHELVDAARQLAEREPRPRILLAGDPDPGNPSSVAPDELQRWSDEGLVELLGHVDSMADAIAAAHLVVLPSYREGTPRILLEAAAMGRPIVTTDVPGCREVVADGENGLLVPARDADALAAAIGALLDDPELCTRMAAAGRERVLQRFDERIVIDRTLEVYARFGI